MVHGNVFGVNDSSCVNGDSHIIGHGMNTDSGADSPTCSLCGGDRYAILNNGNFTDFDTGYYVCINDCSDPTYCIKSEGTGKDCVKMNNDYERGDNDECVVKDRCASLSPCTAGGCGVDDSTGTCKTCDGYSLFIPAEGLKVGHNVCVASEIDNATCENGVCTCNGGYFSIEGYSNSFVTRETECSPCAFLGITQNNECKECTGGKIPNAAKTECVCPEGMVDSNGGCVCQTGVINLAGDSCVSECESGQGYDSNSGKCSVCSANNYSQPRANATGGRVCVSGCDNGYGAAEDGNCKTCSELGKITGPNGGCVDSCPRGTKEDENNNCRPCKDLNKVNQNGGCKEKCNMGYVPDADGVCVTCYKNAQPDKTKYIDYNGGVFDELVNEGLNTDDCKECPTNFICNGAKKIKCPFGTTRTGNSTECTGSTDDNKGFVYAPGNDSAQWEIRTENTYLSLNEDQVKDFKYKSCKNFAAVATKGTIENLAPTYYSDRARYEDFGMQDIGNINIAVCESCGVGHHVASNTCYCGDLNSNYGVVKDSLGLGFTETCQICPNDYENPFDNNQGDYVCKPCSDGKAFYLDTDGKFSCKKCVFEGHASYKKDNEDWCLSYDQLTSALNNTDDNSDRYYRKSEKIDNIPVYSWELCPAGYCCYGGKSTPCIRGTFSGEGTVCEGNSLSGVCTACTNGKTTASTGTECNIKNNNQSTNYASVCSNEVCTSDVEATKFCIDRDNKICFDIDKIKMSASGYYNIKYSD